MVRKPSALDLSIACPVMTLTPLVLSRQDTSSEFKKYSVWTFFTPGRVEKGFKGYFFLASGQTCFSLLQSRLAHILRRRHDLGVPLVADQVLAHQQKRRQQNELKKNKT